MEEEVKDTGEQKKKLLHSPQSTFVAAHCIFALGIKKGGERIKEREGVRVRERRERMRERESEG